MKTLLHSLLIQIRLKNIINKHVITIDWIYGKTFVFIFHYTYISEMNIRCCMLYTLLLFIY
jgi:hypothetical protein